MKRRCGTCKGAGVICPHCKGHVHNYPCVVFSVGLDISRASTSCVDCDGTGEVHILIISPDEGE